MANADKKKYESENDQFAKEYAVAFADKTLERGPYEDGFSSRTILGALFVAVIMMPGSVYLGLVAGASLGPAAEWVTIILFAEMARRSFAHLKRQEVFILFYVASSVAAVTLMHLALSGGPFAACIWNQYLIQSPQTEIIAPEIPAWVAPSADSAALLDRNLWHPDWWVVPGVEGFQRFLSPIVLICIGYLFGRMAWFGLGYLLFRATSDHERLPFPLAPIAAQGATALAESTDRDDAGMQTGKQSWRWNVFSVGATLGIVFGALYIMIPVCSGLFMTKPIMLLPIPFIDLTSRVEGFLPASLLSISFDAGIFIAGMILPFRLVMGTFSAVLITNFVANPILATYGFFPNWKPGSGLLVNQMILNLDLYISVTIGIALAVAAIGMGYLVKSTIRQLNTSKEERAARIAAEDAEHADEPNAPPYRRPSRERGDFPTWLAFLSFFLATCGYIWIAHTLVPGFPVWVFMIFGFIWSPINSYISARLIGLTGTGLVMPYLRETVFVASKYPNVDIWFAPIPLYDVGAAAQQFRTLELTRTKFTSVIKAELAMFPIVLVCSFLFWWFFWNLNQVPSDQFPFAARMWPVQARNAYLIYTANAPREAGEASLLIQAIKPYVIGGVGIGGLLVYGFLSLFKLPVIFFYGLVGGTGQPLHLGLALMAGALAGKYYFTRKFGIEKWGRYVPVVAAGFACGMGLSGMTAVALALIAQCTRQLPF